MSIADVVCGAISVADAVKSSAAEAVAALHARGLRTVLLTGTTLSRRVRSPRRSASMR